MAHVVTERCVDCRYTDCCAVCPVDCFYEIESPAMLVIDPDTCIDCALCVPECPIQAIWPEDELPEEYAEWTEKNAELFENGTKINVKTEPLPGALNLAQLQARERERGWTVKEPSAAKGAPAEGAEAAAEEAEAQAAPAAESPAAATAAPPQPKPAKQRISPPEGLSDSQAAVFDAAANTLYKWRTIPVVARQLQLPQGTVKSELEKLVELGHVKRREPQTKGVTVYGATKRIAS